MKKGLTNFYEPEYLWKIMTGEERCGKLKDNSYSAKVKELSAKLKQLREDYKRLPKGNRSEERQEILDLKELLDKTKQEELKEKSKSISCGKIKLDIGIFEIKGHQALVAQNTETILVCQIIKLELRRSYKLYPANMDMIIEQVKGLLDNPMPKIIIRADIHHFFESIPQEDLLKKIEDDGFVSHRTVKYLKSIFFNSNEQLHIIDNVGLPRGLAFSSHLSELYMRSIDKEIKSMDGIYYYKRYVDDILIVADPTKYSIDDYWNFLKATFEEKKLELHENSEKKYLRVLDEYTENASFDYLGYNFSYSKGKLTLGLSSKRFDKYKKLLSAIFKIYSQCSHYRKLSGRPVEGKSKYAHQDALHQLFSRLEVLTSNGLLSGRKNYVATGIYYSNKYLTDFSLLRQLDLFLYEMIENKEVFCPPISLFNYSQDNGYDKNVAIVKERLHEFSFEKGFNDRRLHKGTRFGQVLLGLQHIYRSME